jgi:hypothetical protein
MCRFTGRRSLLVVVVLMLLLPGISRAQGNWTLGLGFDYERGDYGGDSDISTYSIPLSVFWSPTERYDLVLTIPYVYQSGGTGSLIAGNRRLPAQAKARDVSRSAEQAPGEEDMPAQSPQGSRSGLGDITLEVGYSLLLESARRPLTRLILYGKIPTADDDKGLGTGAFDFGIGTGVGKMLGDWSVYAEVMYMKPGRSRNYRTDDYWTFMAATERMIGKGVSVGTSISLATAADNGDAIWEVGGNFSWRVSSGLGIRGYLIKGLGDEAADFGGGLSTLLSF